LSVSSDAPDGRLLGRPIVIVEALDNTGLSPLGSPILVGDLDLGYELIRIHAPVVLRDEFTSPGFVRFYVRQRWGGILMVNDAIKAPWAGGPFYRPPFRARALRRLPLSRTLQDHRRQLCRVRRLHWRRRLAALSAGASRLLDLPKIYDRCYALLDSP